MNEITFSILICNAKTCYCICTIWLCRALALRALAWGGISEAGCRLGVSICVAYVDIESTDVLSSSWVEDKLRQSSSKEKSIKRIY